MSKSEEEHLADAHANGGWRSMAGVHITLHPAGYKPLTTVEEVVAKWSVNHPANQIADVVKEWEAIDTSKYFSAGEWLREGKSIEGLDFRMQQRFGKP